VKATAEQQTCGHRSFQANLDIAKEVPQRTGGEEVIAEKTDSRGLAAGSSGLAPFIGSWPGSLQ